MGTPVCPSSPRRVYNRVVDPTLTTTLPAPSTVGRSRADQAMRHLLRVPDVQKRILQDNAAELYKIPIPVPA